MNYLVKGRPTWKETVEKSLSQEEMMALDFSVEILSRLTDIRDNNLLDRQELDRLDRIVDSLLDVGVDDFLLGLVSLGYKIEIVKI